MSEEEVKPISKSKSKQQPKTHWFCNKCGNDFWGAKKVAECPQCGEDMDLMVLNEDGLPLEDVRRIVKKRFELASSQPDDPTWG
ncbi:MAG: hypothetical protein KAT65_02565, partial [Methanophagales archaeon]|nr:hypothetical protein [Methanophagales archaeon]